MSEALVVNKRNSLSSKQKTIQILEKIVFVSLMVIIFYAPYLRGLFFELELLPTEIFVFTVFILFWIVRGLKKDREFIKTPIEYAALGFVIVYFISIFTAISLRLAVAEWLKYCMYFAVFFILTDMVKTMKQKMTVLWVIVASATGVALLGLDGAAGGQIANGINKLFELLRIDYKIFGTFQNGRVFSTLQYPNALAAYLFAVFFSILFIIITSKKIFIRTIAAVVGFILATTFFMTLSVGGFFAAGVALVIFIFVLPRGARVKGTVFALVSILPPAGIYVIISKYILNNSTAGVYFWGITFVGIILSALLSACVSFIIKALEKINLRIFFVFIGFIIIMAICIGILTLNSSQPLVLEHISQQADEPVVVYRNVKLKPGDYKLFYFVEASTIEEQNEVYSITIASKNEKEILSDNATNLVIHSGKSTKGRAAREISFKVPQDSKIITIGFTNNHKGTKVVFDNAHLKDAFGKLIKNLKLKYKYLPENIITRFEASSYSKSALERTVFYKDGFRMFKDHWLDGAGGGAWTLLNFSYQSYLYWSNQAHNFILQLGIESGVLGLLILMFVIITISSAFVRMNKKIESKTDKRLFIASCVASISAMLIHSFMDFDFSLSAVFLVFWVFVALLNSEYRHFQEYTKKNQENGSNKQLQILAWLKPIFVKPLIVVLTMMVILVLPITFALAINYNERADRALKKNDKKTSINDMRRAVALDIFQPLYKVKYVNLLISNYNGNLPQKDFNIAKSEIDKAEKLANYDVKLLPEIGVFYLQIGDFEKGISLIERTTQLRPLRPEEWEREVSLYYQIAGMYFGNNDTQSALKYVDKAIDVINRVKNVNKENLVPFIFSSQTDEYIGRLRFIKDNIYNMKSINADKFIFNFVPGMDVNSDGLHDQFALEGNETIANSREDALIVENTKSTQVSFINSRVLNLKAGKTYRIEIKLANHQEIHKIPFIFEGATYGIQEMEKNEGGIYSATVKMVPEFNGNNGKFRLGITGRYEIKSIIIYEE